MTFEKYIMCVLGMGLVTYIPRWAPLVWLSNKDIPAIMQEWLRFIPACILSALVAQAIFLDSSTVGFQLVQARFLAAVPTFIFALKTRSLGGTVIAGMILYWVIGRLI
ncbi:MAG TPA: AzlD domain-containing protein [Desulfomonilia bacterium]|nr:AzlD domain-containing protein [Desulfomonilia bacterium]